MSTNKIAIESIVQNLNEDELAKVCKQYGVEYKAKFGLLRRNLTQRMIKQLNKTSIHRRTFIDKFNDVLSHETKLRIFPEYVQYIERKRVEKLNKINEELAEINEQQEKETNKAVDEYNKAYEKYYNVDSQLVKDTVNDIKAERKKQEMNAFVNKLIKERNNELIKLNNDKLDNTPFTDKINSIKATVERQLRKLKDLEQQEKEWKIEQEQLAKINNDYEDAYNDFYMLPSEQQIFKSPPNKVTFMPASKLSFDEYLTNAEKRIAKAYNQPFNTVIDLMDLTTEDKLEMGRSLKEFYETHIKTAQLNSKILVGYFVNGEWIYRPLDNQQVKETLEKMLNGNYVFSCESIPKIGSDTEVNLSLSFIDAITFKLVENVKSDGERSGHSSAFFPYRLKKEWKPFKAFLKRYQIGCSLYSFKHNKPKEWTKYCCLIYALQQKYPDETELFEEMARKFDGNKYIDTYKLTEIGNIFSIQFTVYKKDSNGKNRKANDSNAGKYGPDNAKYTVEVCIYENHFMIFDKDIPCSAFFIKHYLEVIKNKPIADNEDFMKRCLIYERRPNGSWKTNAKKAHINTLNFIIALMEAGAFEPLYRDDRDVDLSCLHEWCGDEKERVGIPNIEKFNYKLLNNDKPAKDKKPKSASIYYADFETCSQNIEFNGLKTQQEKAFMVCIQSIDGSEKETFIGINCAEQLMDYLPNNAVVYFHNLGFDGRLLMKHGVKSNIMKGSKIITQKHEYKGKHITFKDSYSVFPQKLASFPKAFKNEFKGLNIQKELFPYRYYSYIRTIYGNGVGIISECGNDELPQWTQEQREQFKANIDSIPNCRLGDDEFDMMLYCEFYCQQDVNVLRIGFNAFRESALKPPIEMDIFEITTAPSLANEYLNKNVFYPNGNLYQYSGKLQDYIMGAVYGGRCMTKQNKRWVVDDKILDDFDACSLYPSAMARLFTVEGVPALIPKYRLDDYIHTEWNPHYYLKHAFTEDQTEPTEERFISYGIFDIEIVRVGINRDFPLIVKRDNETNTNMNVNENINMRVDLLQLEDLAHFQKISYKIKGGIYWTGKRDHRIREVIKKLYNQRAQYKKEGNSIQEVIKLIMNSGYGKSIQKPIKTDTKYIEDNKFNHYVYEHYNNINSIKKVDESNIWMVSINKQIEKQFNNCVFGVSVLSMSKRIMNEVMCLAEDLHINIYYQDTDSMHIERNKLPLLADKYKELYKRDLIGNIMGCFHNDFDELKDAYCVFHVSLGKKMYYDELTNDDGEHSEHYRMKGIPNDLIKVKAIEKFNGSVKALYMYLYNGGELEFDLSATKIRFQMEKTGEILHKHDFKRKVRATAPAATSNAVTAPMA